MVSLAMAYERTLVGCYPTVTSRGSLQSHAN